MANPARLIDVSSLLNIDYLYYQSTWSLTITLCSKSYPCLKRRSPGATDLTGS
ncbi:hypothetical protein [Synechocystis sp. CACIAM 05]|uniref:hypothetical protein n=1 Tax=Synechocystis sp. CACIAM 05 TaxID=1933929 RepID=UPI0019501FFF|nr:hypothetical protein [Synechocystis sp. CACIAM 05]